MKGTRKRELPDSKWKERKDNLLIKEWKKKGHNRQKKEGNEKEFLKNRKTRKIIKESSSDYRKEI